MTPIMPMADAQDIISQ